jgi:hypothetical protein
MQAMDSLKLFTDPSRPGPKPQPPPDFECVQHTAPAHGVRVDVFSAVHCAWILLTPTERRDRDSVPALIRVLKRYQTICRSLRRNAPRIQRYHLTAARVVVSPPAGPAYLVEAYGDVNALRTMNELTQGLLLVEPLRADRPKRLYPQPRKKQKKDPTP